MDNINRLSNMRKLIVAGPLEKNENSYRGLFILNNINSMEEAKEILQTDLAIKMEYWIMKFSLGTVRQLFPNIYRLPTKYGKQSLEYNKNEKATHTIAV